MVNKYVIKEFDPLTEKEDNLYKLFDCLDVLFLERNKDDPKPHNEYRLKNFRSESPYLKEICWMVWLNDKVVGYAGITVKTKASPSYEDDKHIAFVNITLQKDHRRMGIGLELMKYIIAKAKEFGVITTFQVGASDESGFAFCEKLQGILAMESAENRLKFNEVNWDLMKEWRTRGQEKAKNDGRRLQWFDNCPEDIIDEYCKVYTETMNQQPFGELENKPIITPETRREQEKEFEKIGYTWQAVITREQDGIISGLTDTIFISGMPYRIFQELTGVLQQYRGNGLGKWLKAEMLFFLHEKYPEVKYISTGNADANAAMLSINHRMGFKLHERRKTYKFKIADLEKRITEIEASVN
ncbi:MAG: GNAT family N-acetyltransferase [Asgard group archaeon]|nr:GNAT family N-acetyltransferase [Asgard group archaeon]